MTETANKLMTHLVINYTDPKVFEEALRANLDAGVEYLELQLPFTNPVADGPVIYEANQAALKYDNRIIENLDKIGDFLKEYDKQKGLKTKLLLMSYFTPAISFGLANLVDVLERNNFSGLIIPDLGVQSVEHGQLTDLLKESGLELIPVISPKTSLERIEKIKQRLQDGQLVYGVARAGKTGNATDMQDPEFLTYLDFLQTNLQGYELAVGFGINEKKQTDFLNDRDIVAVIGSQIVRIIKEALESGEQVEQKVKDFILALK